MGIDKTVLYRKVGLQLKERRKEIQLSQEELAKKIGIERTSITNIESGQQKAPLHVLYQISYVLGVDLVDLLPRNVEVREEEQILVPEVGKKVPPIAAEFLKEIQKSKPTSTKGGKK